MTLTAQLNERAKMYDGQRGGVERFGPYAAELDRYAERGQQLITAVVTAVERIDADPRLTDLGRLDAFREARKGLEGAIGGWKAELAGLREKHASARRRAVGEDVRQSAPPKTELEHARAREIRDYFLVLSGTQRKAAIHAAIRTGRAEIVGAILHDPLDGLREIVSRDAIDQAVEARAQQAVSTVVGRIDTEYGMLESAVAWADRLTAAFDAALSVDNVTTPGPRPAA